MVATQNNRASRLQFMTTRHHLLRVRPVADDIPQNGVMRRTARLCIGQASIQGWQVGVQVGQQGESH